MKTIKQKKNRFKQMAVGFLKDESGQSLTEYALLLFFLVIAVKSVGKGLQGQLQGLVTKVFTNAEQEVP